MTRALCVALLLGACHRPTLDSTFEGALTLRTTMTGEPPKDLQVEVKAGKLRFDMPSNGAAPPVHGIYDAQRDQVVLVLDESKTFIHLDFRRAAGLPPGSMPEASRVAKKGRDHVAGLQCETWTAVQPTGRRTEVCVVAGLRFFDLTRVPSAAQGMSGLDDAVTQGKMLFPVRSVELDASGREVARMEVTRVDAHRVDGARFEVPAGYIEAGGAQP